VSTMNKKYVTALTIAGSDCSGGAGIQADLKTFAALDCYGMSVITALTAQNTQGVQAVERISADFIAAQINSIMKDIEVNAIKLGMLHNQENIAVIAENLQRYQCKNIVLDPVMIAKNGESLLQSQAISTLIEKLIPLATVLTPNIPEAEVLLQNTIKNHADMAQAAKKLTELGCEAVIVKGGHLQEKESADCLYVKKTAQIYWYTAARVVTANTHGTGCTFSAAIAAFLAKQNELITAVKLAKDYLTTAIISGSHYRLGHGHGPVNHLINDMKNS